MKTGEMMIFAVILRCAIHFVGGARIDSDKNLPHTVLNFGYNMQFHDVTTEDGYILEVHRIFKIGEQNVPKKPVVLIMHGLIGSSANWIITGPNRSIVEKGYDVWLGNNRGNTYSRKHISKLETSYGYWDFSWHEMGMYDLPTTIDYILTNTTAQNLLLVCFSEGCTQTFVMGSLKPEYNKKIRFAVALAPAAYVTHVKETVGYFLTLANSPFLRIFTSYLCKEGSEFQPICVSIIFSVIGPGYEELDKEHLVDYLEYAPAGCSIKQLIHYGFGKNNPGTFRQYDYGTERNLQLYNSKTPPDYPLENINFPIAIYHGLNDYLVTSEDLEMLARRLPKVVDKFLVTERKLNHYDMVFGRNIRQLVYNRAIALIEKYTEK